MPVRQMQFCAVPKAVSPYLHTYLNMCSTEAFKIDLRDITDKRANVNYHIDDAFFEVVGGSEVRKGDLDVTLNISKTDKIYELLFNVSGYAVVPCDICLDDMQQPLEYDSRIMARLGDTYSEEDDLITVDRKDGTIDVSWFIYESVVLNLPIKHVHEDGECNPKMLKVLEEHSANYGNDKKEKPKIDSHWNELEKIKTIIKD